MIADLRSFEVSEPDINAECIVLCRDDSCHVAIWKGHDDFDNRDYWFVLGPRGTARRLAKKVLWWAPRPHLPEVYD